MYGTVVEKFSGKLLIQCRGGLLLVDDWEKNQGVKFWCFESIYWFE